MRVDIGPSTGVRLLRKVNSPRSHAIRTGILALALIAAPSMGQDRGVEMPRQGHEPLRGGKRLALCIGIDGYDRAGRYPPLRHAVADARALAVAFRGLGYETLLLVDDAEDQTLLPTYANIDGKLWEIARRAATVDDTLVVTFAGHGDVQGEQSVLLPLDYGTAGRPLTLSHLFDHINGPHCRARKKLLVLDACRSAREDSSRRLANGFLQAVAQPETSVVLTSCGASEQSFEDGDLGHGRFSAVLLEGLAGAAFGEGREFLLASELFEYIRGTFEKRRWLDAQRPQMFGRWDAGVRFDLARRDLPRSPPNTPQDHESFDIVIRRAHAAEEGGDLVASVGFATSALRILEGEPRALALRARCYEGLGYRTQAMEDAQAALAREPAEAMALQVRGMCAYANRRFQESADDLKRASDLVEASPSRWPSLASGEETARRWFGMQCAVARGDSHRSALAARARSLHLAREGVPAERLARAQRLVRLGTLQEGQTRPDRSLKTSLNLSHERDGRPTSPVAPRDTLVLLRDGDSVFVRISNDGEGPVDAALLFIDSAYGVQQIWPVGEGGGLRRAVEEKVEHGDLAPGTPAEPPAVVRNRPHRLVPGEVVIDGPYRVISDTIGPERVLLIAVAAGPTVMTFDWFVERPFSGPLPNAGDATPAKAPEHPFARWITAVWSGDEQPRPLALSEFAHSDIRMLTWVTLPKDPGTPR